MAGLDDSAGRRSSDDRVGGRSRTLLPITVVDDVTVLGTAAAALAGLLCVVLVLKDFVIHCTNSIDGGKHTRGQAGIVADVVSARAFALALAALAALEVPLMMLPSLGGLANRSSICICSGRLYQGR